MALFASAGQPPVAGQVTRHEAPTCHLPLATAQPPMTVVQFEEWGRSAPKLQIIALQMRANAAHTRLLPHDLSTEIHTRIEFIYATRDWG